MTMTEVVEEWYARRRHVKGASCCTASKPKVNLDVDADIGRAPW
jgi:hypothetical protein